MLRNEMFFFFLVVFLSLEIMCDKNNEMTENIYATDTNTDPLHFNLIFYLNTISFLISSYKTTHVIA